MESFTFTVPNKVKTSRISSSAALDGIPLPTLSQYQPYSDQTGAPPTNNFWQALFSWGAISGRVSVVL
jgi:hypothetical protein